MMLMDAVSQPNHVCAALWWAYVPSQQIYIISCSARWHACRDSVLTFLNYTVPHPALKTSLQLKSSKLLLLFIYYYYCNYFFLYKHKHIHFTGRLLYWALSCSLMILWCPQMKLAAGRWPYIKKTDFSQKYGSLLHLRCQRRSFVFSQHPDWTRCSTTSSKRFLCR